MICHEERVFPLSRRFLIARYDLPAIFVVSINIDLPCSHVHHRLYRKHHSRYKEHPRASVTIMVDVRLLVELKPHSMSAQVAYNPVMIFVGMFLDGMSYVANE